MRKKTRRQDTRLDQQDIARRRFIGGAMAGLGAIVAVKDRAATPETDAEATEAAAAPAHSPELAALVAPFVVGAAVGPDFTLAQVVLRESGVGRLSLRGESSELLVDVCARDTAMPALVETERFGLYLCNGGKGNTPTDEGAGVALMALAEAIRRNETTAELAVVTKRESWQVA